MSRGTLNAAHLTAIVAATVDQLARDDPVGQGAAWRVDVLQEEVQRQDALRQAALDGLPLGVGQDARHQVIGEDALGAILLRRRR